MTSPWPDLLRASSYVLVQGDIEAFSYSTDRAFKSRMAGRKGIRFTSWSHAMQEHPARLLPAG